jgi:hypothetical protein
MARPPRVEMGHWTERIGDQILFHSAPITVPKNTDGLSYKDVLRLNGIDVPPSPSALAAKTDESSPPKRIRRRRRPSKAKPIHPDIRELYRYYLEGGWSADGFADHLGFTRVSIWGWFNNLHFPDAVTREQIEVRTKIKIHRLSGQR